MLFDAEKYLGWEVDYTSRPENFEYSEEEYEEDALVARIVLNLYSFPREDELSSHRSAQNFLGYYYQNHGYHLEIAGVDEDRTLLFKWVLEE